MVKCFWNFIYFIHVYFAMYVKLLFLCGSTQIKTWKACMCVFGIYLTGSSLKIYISARNAVCRLHDFVELIRGHMAAYIGIPRASQQILTAQKSGDSFLTYYWSSEKLLELHVCLGAISSKNWPYSKTTEYAMACNLCKTFLWPTFYIIFSLNRKGVTHTKYVKRLKLQS